MHKLLPYLKKVDIKKYGAVGIAVVMVVIIIVAANTLTRPKRSVAAYCKVYHQQKTQLGNPDGNNAEFSTSVFPNASSNDPGYFIPTFNKLAAVAPTQIEPQVVTMRDTWQKMKGDPTNVLSLALNGIPAETTVTQWTQQHCGD